MEEREVVPSSILLSGIKRTNEWLEKEEQEKDSQHTI